MKDIVVIGLFNVEVTNFGKDIKVFRRRITGKELIFDFAISDADHKSKDDNNIKEVSEWK